MISDAWQGTRRTATNNAIVGNDCSPKPPSFWLCNLEKTAYFFSCLMKEPTVQIYVPAETREV